MMIYKTSIPQPGILRRRMLALLTALGAAAVLGAPGISHAQAELKLGHVGNPGSLFQISADEFAKRANDKLGDKYKVVVFGSSQLGGTKEMLQKLKLRSDENR